MKKSLISLVLFISTLFAVPDSLVYRVPIEGVIDLGLPPFIERSLKMAEEEGAVAVIFDIDTFGGRVDAAPQIKDAILDSPLLTVAFINRRAISAGALISMSCDKIYMTSGGTIGAATAVDMQGQKGSEKVISYMREEMASTAEDKASILEDDLVAELAELEDELEDGTEHDELEDQILKELEDLENF